MEYHFLFIKISSNSAVIRELELFYTEARKRGSKRDCFIDSYRSNIIIRDNSDVCMVTTRLNDMDSYGAIRRDITSRWSIMRNSASGADRFSPLSFMPTEFCKKKDVDNFGWRYGNLSWLALLAGISCVQGLPCVFYKTFIPMYYNWSSLRVSFRIYVLFNK